MHSINAENQKYNNYDIQEICPINQQLNNQKISSIINEKIRNCEYFYGLEIFSKYDLINFKISPLFLSIVWFGPRNIEVEPFWKAPALVLGNKLRCFGPILSHLSCYKMTKTKLNEIFINLTKPKNYFAIRGDQIDNEQEFKYGVELVRELRQIGGDEISIGVAGYPDGHPEAISREDDLKYLKNKVNSGADFIITQFCFSEENIKKFIEDCRSNGITIPIIVGIFVPYNLKSLKRLCEITKVSVPIDQLLEYEKFHENDKEFENYANLIAIKLIKNLFNSNLNIYGIQFFTLDYFDNIKKIVQEIF